MKLEGLIFTGNAEKDKILHAAIEKLPDYAIKNLSDYGPSSVYLEKSPGEVEKVVIKRIPGGDRLDLDLSDPGFTNIQIGETIEFTYQGTRYSISRD